MRYRRPSIAGVSILSMYPSMGGNNLKQALRHALVGRPLLARLSETASAAVPTCRSPGRVEPGRGTNTSARAHAPQSICAQCQGGKPRMHTCDASETCGNSGANGSGHAKALASEL